VVATEGGRNDRHAAPFGMGLVEEDELVATTSAGPVINAFV